MTFRRNFLPPSSGYKDEDLESLWHSGLASKQHTANFSSFLPQRINIVHLLTIHKASLTYLMLQNGTMNISGFKQMSDNIKINQYNLLSLKDSALKRLNGPKNNILNNKIQTDPAVYWNNSNNTRPDHKHRHALGAATRSGVAESGSRAMLSERKRVREKSNCMEISHPFTSSAKLQSALLVKNLDKKCKVLVTCFVR